ncbi:hypothetical protein [Qipengyuania soli]|nr:hypothetical protein [Qipengyuania soli]
MLRKIIIASLMAAGALSLSACNTVRGLGEDLQSAANSVDDAT